MHDFVVYTPDNYVGKDYVLELRSVYMPLMDRYTPVTLKRIKTVSEVNRLYLSADMFPHMPYRALRELEYDYRHGETSKEQYDLGKEIFTKATVYGAPLPYFTYFYRNNYPGFTIPLQIHPENNTVHAYSIYALPLIEDDCRKTVEKTLKRFMQVTYSVLKRTFVAGYVPKLLLENPVLLYNLFVLYATFLPMEILRHAEAPERMLEMAVGRGYARLLPGMSDPIVRYYQRNILPHTVLTIEENLEYPGIATFDPYGPYARASLILNLTTSALRREGMPGMVNPFPVTLNYLFDAGKTIRDVLMVAIRDEIMPYMPENTFSFGSLLYAGIEKRVNVNTTVEADVIFSESNVSADYMASTRRRITEFLLSQVFPILSARNEIDRLKSAYSKYENVLHGTSAWRVLSTDTEYVDDRLVNLLYKPSVDEVLEGRLEN